MSTARHRGTHAAKPRGAAANLQPTGNGPGPAGPQLRLRGRGALAWLALAACLVPGAAAADPPATCPDLGEARPLAYRNDRIGVAMAYPPGFALDRESVPASGDSAQFRTADGRASAMVTGVANGLGQSLSDLLREARQDVLENSRGSVTYQRAKDGWFVLSGFIGDRVYYRRTMLAQGGRMIATLWIEFPRGLRPCFDDAVATMSLSFQER